MSEVPISNGPRTDWFGVALGAIVFLVGVGFLGATFFYALNMFTTPPEVAVGVGENPDIARIGISFGEVVLRIGLLLVMSIVGSVISRHGVRMYQAARVGYTKQHE